MNEARVHTLSSHHYPSVFRSKVVIGTNHFENDGPIFLQNINFRKSTHGNSSRREIHVAGVRVFSQGSMHRRECSLRLSTCNGSQWYLMINGCLMTLNVSND